MALVKLKDNLYVNNDKVSAVYAKNEREVCVELGCEEQTITIADKSLKEVVDILNEDTILD